MMRYQIKKTILLGFTSGNKQADVLLDPGLHTLEFDGETIWVVNDRGRHESITVGSALNGLVREGYIEEIKPDLQQQRSIVEG